MARLTWIRCCIVGVVLKGTPYATLTKHQNTRNTTLRANYTFRAKIPLEVYLYAYRKRNLYDVEINSFYLAYK